jgi:hypothetical protein
MAATATFVRRVERERLQNDIAPISFRSMIQHEALVGFGFWHNPELIREIIYGRKRREERAHSENCLKYCRSCRKAIFTIHSAMPKHFYIAAAAREVKML